MWVLIISILSFFVSKQISKDFAVKALICWFQQTVFITFLLNQKKNATLCSSLDGEKKRNTGTIWIGKVYEVSSTLHLVFNRPLNIINWFIRPNYPTGRQKCIEFFVFFVFVLFKHCTFLFHFFPLMGKSPFCVQIWKRKESVTLNKSEFFLNLPTHMLLTLNLEFLFVWLSDPD